MGNQKLYITGKYKDENGNEVLKTELRDVQVPCKECGKEPRAEKSSRCKKCSDGYKLNKYRQERLQNKVEKQVKNYQ